jgi:hypothetical protein
MPSTTNFGWTTPADTDLVKDGAAAIRTLGNGIDTSLVDLKGGTTGQVLSKASNTDLDFTWVAQDDSNAIQNALLTTTGDTIYASSASTPARLGIGSTGQVLTVSGGVPVWATPAGGGKILQVVNTTLTSGNFTTSSTSFVDVTNLNVSITPAATGSRIMVFLTATCSASASSGGNVDMRFALVRGSTTITEARFDLENNTGSSTSLGLPITLHYVDSPSTTSSTTYKVQVRYVNFSSSVTVQANTTNKAMLTVMEIGA